jgi:hypothetical protein
MQTKASFHAPSVARRVELNSGSGRALGRVGYKSGGWRSSFVTYDTF